MSELMVGIADSMAFRHLLTTSVVIVSLPALCWIGVRPCMLREETQFPRVYLTLQVALVILFG
jgi:hypothetical protein